MIIVIFMIFLTLVIISSILKQKYDTWEVIGGISAFLMSAAIVAFLILLIEFSAIKPISAKIDMYLQENEKIEAQITECVTNYQKHEEKIFTEVAPENAITLASLYPELKSDTLVKQQINIYIANNEKIKELKNEELNASTYRWWLYFGH